MARQARVDSKTPSSLATSDDRRIRGGGKLDPGPGCMRRRTPWRWARPCCGALVLLCIWGLGAPSPARAECAHYVKPVGGALDQAVQLELLSRVKSLTEPISLPVSERRSPCPGGICSRGPILPLAPAPPAPAVLNQWGLLLAAWRHIEPDKPLHATEAPLRLPEGPCTSIDHPPRLTLLPLLAG